MEDTATRGNRDVWIDWLRATSVAIVVVGHWLTTTVIWDDDSLGIENALSVIRSSHPVTWLIQVMPVMFFVGGFSNFRSLERHHGSGAAFLRTRYRRLLAPTVVFIGVWLAISIATEMSGAGLPNPADRAADLASLPFWFLGLYLLVVALAPAMINLHHRFGWRVLAAMVASVLVVDITHYGLDVPNIGTLNFAFVWLSAHQLGFLYADGTLVRAPRRVVAVATVGGLVALAALTTVAGYPVSMVGVPGDERWNTNPPSLALVALTVWLIGLALLLRPTIVRWLASTQRRRRLAWAQQRVLTVYLWHVSALAGAAIALRGVAIPQPDTGSGAWWAQRSVWLATAAGVLAFLVFAFARFETHPEPGKRREAVPLAAPAVVSIGIGLLGFGVTGFNRIAQQLGEDLLGFALNPLTNLIHLSLGIALLGAVLFGSRWARLVALLVTAAFMVMGVAGLGERVAVLATNEQTAMAQLVMGIGTGAVLLGDLARSES